MKLFAIDFKQPSTWRGLFGLVALAGYSLSPELREQIIVALVAIVSAIELVRNEYADRDGELLASQRPSPGTEGHPALAAEGLCQPTPGEADSTGNSLAQPSSFGDR